MHRRQRVLPHAGGRAQRTQRVPIAARLPGEGLHPSRQAAVQESDQGAGTQCRYATFFVEFFIFLTDLNCQAIKIQSYQLTIGY